MNLTGIVTAVLSAIFMGTMGLFSRKTGLDSELITFFRLIIGSGFLALLLLATRQLRLICRWPGWPVLISGLMLAGFIIFYVQAMYLTTMANAIMILYLAPLLASVYAHFFLGERLTLVSTGLICAALFGFAMMMEFHIDFSTGSNHFLGIAFSAAGMICYATFILINRTIRPEVHVYTRTFYQLLAGALCMIPLFITKLPPIPQANWPWLLGAGFIPGFLGILFAVIALEKLPAATFGTLAYIEPICVVIIGYSVFGETLNLLQLSGCMLIICSGAIKGILTARTKPQPSRKDPGTDLDCRPC